LGSRSNAKLRAYIISRDILPPFPTNDVFASLQDLPCLFDGVGQQFQLPGDERAVMWVACPSAYIDDVEGLVEKIEEI